MKALDDEGTQLLVAAERAALELRDGEPELALEDLTGGFPSRRLRVLRGARGLNLAHSTRSAFLLSCATQGDALDLIHDDFCVFS